MLIALTDLAKARAETNYLVFNSELSEFSELSEAGRTARASLHLWLTASNLYIGVR